MFMQHDLVLIINSQCNNVCAYCPMSIEERTHVIEMSTYDLDHYLLQVLLQCKPININIVGGEPGLCNPDNINKLLTICDSYFRNHIYPIKGQIVILTNGLFITKYHDTLPRYKYTNISYLWHLSPEFYEYNMAVIPYRPYIKYNCVVHRYNIYELEGFLKRNCYFGHKFELLPAFATENDHTMSDEQEELFKRIIIRYKDHVTQATKNYLVNANVPLATIRCLCRSLMPLIKLDFTNNSLYPCCMFNYTKGFDLKIACASDIIGEFKKLTTHKCDDCYICKSQIQFDSAIKDYLKIYGKFPPHLTKEVKEYHLYEQCNSKEIKKCSSVIFQI